MGLTDLLNDFDATLPLNRAKSIPSAWYFDASLAKLEREKIFARSWQYAGRVDQLKKIGDYLTVEIAGESIIILRNDQNQIQAMHNVCRHRAAPLLCDESGQVNKLRCRYHGWTYDLSGRLKGTPEFDSVCDFAHEENGLVNVAEVDVSGPFIFVSLTRPTNNLKTALAPLSDWTWPASQAGQANPTTGLEFYQRKSYDIACNWKVYVDNYLDGGYHVNTVHPALAGVLDYREYKTTTDGITVLQSSPLKASAGLAGQTRTGSEAAYWWIYPNLMINLYSGVMDVNIVQPLGPERCRVHFDFYFAKDVDAAFAENSINVANQVQMEDGEICEQVQQNLHSRSYSTGRFSVKRENGGYYFHQLLAKQLRGDSTVC